MQIKSVTIDKPDPNDLKIQWEKYRESCIRIDARKNNEKEIEEIQKIFSENKVKCIKCNFTLDESIQNFMQFDSFLELKNDEMMITNKKIIEEPEYILEADQKVMQSKQDQNKVLKSFKVDRLK